MSLNAGLRRSDVEFTDGDYSLLSSGGLVSGWTWWSMTVYPPEMESCCLFTQRRALSFGHRCWRRPMLSMDHSSYVFNEKH